MRRMLAVLAVLGAVAACTGDDGDVAPEPDGNADVASFSAAVDDIEVAVGDEFTIDVEVEPVTGYRWRLMPSDAALERFRTRYEREPGVRQLEPRAAAIEIFLQIDVTPEQLGRLEAELRADPAVADDGVTFVSQQAQYDLFTEYFADHPEYLKDVAAEDLPPSFVATLRSIGEDVVELVDHDLPRAGAITLRLAAVAAGTATITLRYSNQSGMDTEDRVETFDITVT